MGIEPSYFQPNSLLKNEKTQKIPLKTATLSDWVIPRLKKGQKSIFQKKKSKISNLKNFKKSIFYFSRNL